MKLSTKLVMLAGVLALAACTNPDRFGADGANGMNGTGMNGGMVPGSASDPTSVAYFQQSVGDRVLFLVDQSTLTAEGRATLDGQAAWLSQNGLHGHHRRSRRRAGHTGIQPCTGRTSRRCRAGLSGQPGRAVVAFAHHQLWQGTAHRSVQQRSMLCKEPPRCDSAGRWIDGVR